MKVFVVILLLTFIILFNPEKCDGGEDPPAEPPPADGPPADGEAPDGKAPDGEAPDGTKADNDTMSDNSTITTTTFTPPTLEQRPDLPGDDGCSIETPNPNLAPVYIQMLNEYESVFMPKEDLAFKLGNNVKMLAICPSGFVDANEIVISITCINGELVNDDDTLFDNILTCKTNERSQLFEKKGDTECPKTLYAIGLNVSGEMIIFAESCYDKEKEEVYYVHYRATKSSQFLSNYIPEIFLIDNAFDDVRTWDKIEDRFENRKELTNDQIKARNRRNLNITENTKVKKKRSLSLVTNQFIYKRIQEAIAQIYVIAELPIVNHDDNLIKDEISKLLKDASLYLFFNETKLLPPDIYEPFVKNPFENREILQKVYGWDNLVFGNWRYFHKLLKLQSSEENFEIYTGTSGTSNVPSLVGGSNCIAPLDYNEAGSIFTIPLEVKLEYDIIVRMPKYFWAYIRSMDPAKSFVVIGINAPYYDYFPDVMESNIKCNDMCESVQWLEKLEKFRKHDPFGKIICCPVDEVISYLYGFPYVT